MCRLATISLLNYPGKVAATLFFPGCNLRCGFCHNPSLLFSPPRPFLEYRQYIEKKQRYISGVCFTGGEPLLSFKKVQRLLRFSKSLNLYTKLDTNGFFPEELKALLDEQLLNYIAMDIKAPKSCYRRLTPKLQEINNIEKSIQLIQNCGLDYEFRTTVIPAFFSEKEARNISKWIAGSKKYVLQAFSNTSPTLDPSFTQFDTPSVDYLKQLQAIFKTTIEQVELR